MNAKKKPLGIRHKIREEKKREQRVGVAITVAILLAIILILGFLVNSMLNQPSTSQTTTSRTRAAIVDQASLSPAGGFDEVFVENVSNTLKQARYIVDYYPGESVTVEFYRNLPAQGYKVIVLRVHSAISLHEALVTLFTSEPYDQTKYVSEQLHDQLNVAAYSQEDFEKGITYFGLKPAFVTESMRGSFENTTIIMMGCNGLTYTNMAEAFMEKGSKVYIGWDRGIFFFHADVATICLLRHLVIEREAIGQAVYNTVKDVGVDPAENATLTFYPPGVRQEAI